jgi:acyl carrier protein
MNVTNPVLRVLDEALNLQGRALAFNSSTPLLGALPELDSMAVLALITGLENQFGIAFQDDQLDGAAFATVGSLTALVEQTLADAGA